jgi:hypothetical protein
MVGDLLHFSQYHTTSELNMSDFFSPYFDSHWFEQITYLTIHIKEVFNVTSTLAELVFSTRTFLMVNFLVLNNKLLRTLMEELKDFMELKLKHDPKKSFAKGVRCMTVFPRLYFSLGWFSFILNGILPACYQYYRFFTNTATPETYVLPTYTQ